MRKMYIKILTVSALNNYIKKIMDNDFILNNIHVKGEISNFKFHESGHLYFSIKDEGGKINAVMFRTSAAALKFMPENGMNVEVKGRVSVYQKDGSYQLYCDEMKQVGIGDLYIAFMKLKEKLEKEGLFSEKHKKEIPLFPRRIGIITSPSGAAVRDIINVAKRRNKNVDLLIYPSLVQGSGASTDLINGIKVLNNIEEIDVIILARGGGSIEELWSFNDEMLAYAVFNSKKPIITGVGHETDFTIVDFVSDRRAPTPSAAAEIAVPSLNELDSRLSVMKRNLYRVYKNEISEKYNKVKMLNKTLEINNPLNYIINAYNFIDNLRNRLNHNAIIKLNGEKEKLSRINAVLNAHNPLNVLHKGYAVIQDCDNNVISEIERLKALKEINIILRDGKIKGSVDFTEV
jgi:exodeoxyribonuclease VII large subunit